MTSEVGARLRNLREKARLSLRDLARQTGMSVSQLSKIETGQQEATLSALRKVVDALGTSLGELFTAIEQPPQPRPVRRGEGVMLRRRPESGSGVVEEFLHLEAGALMEPELMMMPPRSDSGPALRHPGEEFFYVLDGEVHFFYGDTFHETFRAGDSLYYASSTPHRWENQSERFVTILIVNSPPVI